MKNINVYRINQINPGTARAISHVIYESSPAIAILIICTRKIKRIGGGSNIVPFYLEISNTIHVNAIGGTIS